MIVGPTGLMLLVIERIINMALIGVVSDIGLAIFFVILLCVILFYFEQQGDI